MGQLTVNVFGFFILLLFESKFGMTAVEISKACFGTQGPQLLCTRHDLRCSSGRIRIQETFYMDSSVCVATRLTNCANINISNIPLTGTKYNFSDTELNSVQNCSGQPTCSFQAGRSGAQTFSVISYHCINDTTQTVATVTTNSMLTARPGSNETSTPKQTSETNNGLGGMFAAGFFTGLGVAAIISGVLYFLFIRRRCVIKKPEPEPEPESLPPPAYTGLADLGLHETYDVINKPEGVTTSSEPCQAPVYQNMDDVS